MKLTEQERQVVIDAAEKGEEEILALAKFRNLAGFEKYRDCAVDIAEALKMDLLWYLSTKGEKIAMLLREKSDVVCDAADVAS